MDYSSNVDNSRPFSSVKEAVAIFGERFLVGEIYTPKSFTFPKQETPFFSPSPSPKIDKDATQWNYSSPSSHRRSSYCQNATLSETVKKLESELEETKFELNQLKERESETGATLASLNAELHNNMSKLARAEAKVVGGMEDNGTALVIRQEEKKRDAYLRMESKASTSLAQILSFGENELDLFVGGKKKESKVANKKKKQKPIIPLVGDLFAWKKGSSSTTTMHNSLYASSHMPWN